MPCESCNIQFTVFKRKRTCGDCRRYYCSNCLTISKRNTQILLCERCAIFSKRPLLHSDLLQLKPKDLIFYLQSKHISTTGCVEKDELIKLVLNYVHQTDSTHKASSSSGSQQQQQQPHQQRNSPTDPSANSFDNIRQTCQNFFFNITENISDSLSAFDSKTTKSQQDNNNRNSNSNDNGSGNVNENSASNRRDEHIVDQPRVSRREIPSYASSQAMPQSSPSAQNAPNSTATLSPSTTTATTASLPPRTTTTILINERDQSRPSASASISTRTKPTQNDNSQSSSGGQKTSTSSSLASPIISISSIASQEPANEADNIETELNLNAPKISDCECSDDELFATYTARNSLTTPMQVDLTAFTERHRATGKAVQNLKLAPCDGDEASQSSFEELGAVGCSGSIISDDSKGTEGTEESAGSSNADAWQILETKNETTSNVPTVSTSAVMQTENVEIIETVETGEIGAIEEIVDTGEATEAVIQSQSESQPPRKKLLRRRSDRQRSTTTSQELNSPTTSTAAAGIATKNGIERTTTTTTTTSVATSATNEQDELSRRRSGTCRRCGKSNLKRYVEKMRQHLESAQLSEAEIKRELNDFLAYLEEQTKSLDYSETETTASPLPNESNAANAQVVLSPTINTRNVPFFPDFNDENDGIHVYGAEASAYTNEHNPRFVNLNDYDLIEDLEYLTVKQLKEVLMLHRVDYKGCCEKQELLDRVQRLWKNLKSAPAVEKLQKDELCKICMDAPIECVILECGHMATCTNCGKILSECPICRQYIVRVVRFFRA